MNGYCKTALCLYFILLATTGHSQNNDKQQAISLLKELQNRYMHFKAVGMTLHYYYANEKQPKRHLDSLDGEVVLDDKNYRIKMSNTETVANERYMISVFNDDKLMYVTKQQQSITSRSNPVAAIDTILLQLPSVTLTVQQDKNFKTVLIHFSEESPYKSMGFYIDTSTGYLMKTVAIVKTALMSPGTPPNELKEQGYDDFAVVETIIDNYIKQNLPPDYFSESRFFIKQGQDFVATEQYKGFTIFKGSPNL